MKAAVVPFVRMLWMFVHFHADANILVNAPKYIKYVCDRMDVLRHFCQFLHEVTTTCKRNDVSPAPQ